MRFRLRVIARSVALLVASGAPMSALAQANPAMPQPAMPQPALPQARAASFDSFLSGFTSCAYSDAFLAFWRGSVDRFGNEPGAKRAIVKRSVTVPVPSALRDAIDVTRAVSRLKGEFTLVTIPARGVFNGLPVKAIELSIGSENGISAAQIYFDAPRATVVRTFQAAIKSGNAAIKKRGDDDGAQPTSGLDPKQPAIYCDSST